MICRKGYIFIARYIHASIEFPIVPRKDIDYSKYKALVQLWYYLMAIFKKLFWRCYTNDYRYLLTELLIFYVNRILRITFFAPVMLRFHPFVGNFRILFLSINLSILFDRSCFCTQLSDYKYINISQNLRANNSQIL